MRNIFSNLLLWQVIKVNSRELIYSLVGIEFEVDTFLAFVLNSLLLLCIVMLNCVIHCPHLEGLHFIMLEFQGPCFMRIKTLQIFHSNEMIQIQNVM